MPNAMPGYYILEYRNTKLAVVEAKAWDVALTEGVAQGKNYAGKLAVRFGKRVAAEAAARRRIRPISKS